MTEGFSEQKDFEERLRAKVEAYHDAALLYAAMKLGLPEKMQGRELTADALAVELGLSAPHLHRLLRGLASLGILTERPDGAFALTAAGQCLVPGSPSRLWEKTQVVVAQYWQPWANLAQTVETGKAAFEQVFGTNVSDWRRDHADHGALFDSYLAHEMLAQAPALVASLAMSDVRIVADIGGGYGGLLAAILQAHQDLAGILFDRPHRIEAALPFLQSQGVAARVERIGGDLLANIQVEADLYLLNGVLRQYEDAQARAILTNCRKAMADGARLAIIERLLPEQASDEPAAIMLDLHMMAITGGRVRKLAEFEVLLSETRLAPSKVTPTPSGPAVIMAIPA